MNKKIVIIADVHFDDKATGMAQTLANLFENYPNNKLLFCIPQMPSGRFRHFNSITYEGLTGNRLARKFFSNGILKKYFEKIKLPGIEKKILQFQPGLLLISNLSYATSSITLNLYKKYKIPVCVYLMDYISQHVQNDFEVLYEPLMKIAVKYIFISKYMAEYYTSIYPSIKNYLVTHNPVEENEIALSPVINEHKNEISFAYAGSLWQMHFDALLLFAKGLNILKRKNINTSLTVYSAPHFYKMYKKKFSELNIAYGGFFGYDQLKPHLLKHHALIVASSFDKSFYGLSAYSVQTKVTDYLACGVPVISIGPPYAACNKFISDNNCGFVINENDPEQVAKQVEKYLKINANCISEKAANGLRLINVNYRKEKVQEMLYNFLEAGEKN